jgi:hypothetical protein
MYSSKRLKTVFNLFKNGLNTIWENDILIIPEKKTLRKWTRIDNNIDVEIQEIDYYRLVFP